MKVFAERWHKAWSTWLLVTATTLSGLQMFLPEIQQALPPDWYRYAFGVILLARIIKQGVKDAPAS